MSNKISCAKAKVEWADKHIDDLKEELVHFQNTYPYKFSAQRDPETRQPIYHMTEVAEIPVSISLISGDVLHGLRSALDYLMWSFSENPTSFTSFPIFDPSKVEESYLPRKIGGLSPAGQKIITDLKPYKGGNEILWRLHQLNITDKHHLLVTASTSLRSLDINQHRANVSHGGSAIVESRGQHFVVRIAEARHIAPQTRVFPLKAGDVLLVDPPDAKIDENIDFRFDVAFNEPGIADGDPILGTFNQSLNLVREIIDSFAQLP